MLKLYNTFTKSLETLESTGSDIKIYLCGPTVQSSPHIGHGRSAVVFDFMVRYIKFSGNSVIFARNITDIDDKIIEKSIEENISYKELGDRVTKEFKDSYDKLNCLTPDFEPKATETIDQMIDLIDDLIRKDYAYVTKSGVYFDVSKYDSYLELSGRSFDEVLSGTRVNIEEDKKNSEDFALWKISKENEPSWKSPWGNGRPGWHIECSAMIHDIFKGEIDIHCGGNDLIFPHHENEIAQSCAASGKPFVNYWLHNEHLLVEGQKMSKSLGNFYSLRDLLNKGHSSGAIRYTLISTHYRSKLNFTSKKVEDSQKCINKLIELKRRLENVIKIHNDSGEDISRCDSMLNHFSSKLADDLNISGALGELFSWVNLLFAKLDKNKINYVSAKNSLQALNRVDSILGVLNYNDNLNIDDKVKELIDERSKARNEKNWEKADKIRIQLDDLGIILEDTKDGVVWKRK